MEMTIEEAIEFKKHGYYTPLSSFENIDDMNAQISKCAEYDRLVLDTIRKYQKIQEIMGELNGNFYDSYLKDRQTLEKIYEVLEDGNGIHNR